MDEVVCQDGRQKWKSVKDRAKKQLFRAVLGTTSLSAMLVGVGVFAHNELKPVRVQLDSLKNFSCVQALSRAEWGAESKNFEALSVRSLQARDILPKWQKALKPIVVTQAAPIHLSTAVEVQPLPQLSEQDLQEMQAAYRSLSRQFMIALDTQDPVETLVSHQVDEVQSLDIDLDLSEERIPDAQLVAVKPQSKKIILPKPRTAKKKISVSRAPVVEKSQAQAPAPKVSSEYSFSVQPQPTTKAIAKVATLSGISQRIHDSAFEKTVEIKRVPTVLPNLKEKQPALIAPIARFIPLKHHLEGPGIIPDDPEPKTLSPDPKEESPVEARSDAGDSHGDVISLNTHEDGRLRELVATQVPQGLDSQSSNITSVSSDRLVASAAASKGMASDVNPVPVITQVITKIEGAALKSIQPKALAGSAIPAVVASSVASPAPRPLATPEKSRAKEKAEEKTVEKAVENHKSEEEGFFTKPRHPFVDGFDVSSEIHLAFADVVSHEGLASGNQAKWTRITAPAYWPTLALVQSHALGTPLFSQNTLQYVEMNSKIYQQAGTGMVMIRVLNGWRAKLSARSEEPIYLDATGQVLADEKASGVRLAFFKNVEPGGHLLYMTQSTGEAGAISFPVEPGTLTYLDPERPKISHFNGHVLSTLNARPIRFAQVRVLGRAASAFTDHQGYFQMENVIAFNHYPLIVETEHSKGYVHRYHMSSSQLSNAELYRVDSKMYDAWTSELEGGISSQGGVLFAAIPEAVMKAPSHELSPKITPFLEGGTLQAESYPLTQEGHLFNLSPTGEVELIKKITRQSPRFVSVHLSEGVHTATLQEGAETVWSEMINASPNVIQIVQLR